MSAHHYDSIAASMINILATGATDHAQNRLEKRIAGALRDVHASTIAPTPLKITAAAVPRYDDVALYEFADAGDETHLQAQESQPTEPESEDLLITDSPGKQRAPTDDCDVRT